MDSRRVSFTSEGCELVGDLYLPEGAGAESVPGVVLTGPFSSVKEQVTGTYAAKLADRGVAALAFDHRNWGASQGGPRQHEDPTAKLTDLRDAVGFLGTLAEVDRDRIGMVGVCLGGAYATVAAAFDPRVRALALIGSSYLDPATTRERMGDLHQQYMARFAEVAQRQLETGEVEYWPAVSAAPTLWAGMPNPEAFEYYGTSRGQAGGWENRVTALSVKAELTLASMFAIPLLAPTPLLVAHGRTDLFLPPEDAQLAYERAGEPKEIFWLDTTNHIDIYDQDAHVDPAADHTAAWLGKHLAAGSASG
jgi:fermentation-respiration switch protein FrsA (DUF1100 family)